MISSIFTNSFYSLVKTPNKEDIFKALNTIKVDREKSEEIVWNKNCEVEVEILYKDEMGRLLFPAVEIFLQELGISIPVELLSIWRNTYQKGGYQEIHDHIDGEGLEECHLSGCFFLDDFHPEGGKFFFQNRHSSELGVAWRKVIQTSPALHGPLYWFPEYKAGDIIFFPSYMLHGVTPHGLDNPRTTISFNMKFVS